MEVAVDSAGRILVPKQFRDALGLRPGTEVDVSRYGSGLLLTPADHTARLIEENGVLVASGNATIDDDDVFALIDAGRR